MINLTTDQKTELQPGTRVYVDFTHQLEKNLPEIRFHGEGVLDRVENGRVYGRLDDGQTFTCMVSDMEILDSVTVVEKSKIEAMREGFEKAYEPNPHKSPFTEIKFNEEKQIYEPLNPSLDYVARSLNAAWYGWRIRQDEVDRLQEALNFSNRMANLDNNKIEELQQNMRTGNRLLYTKDQSIDLLIKDRDELQKRVETALEKLDVLRQVELWQEDKIIELYDELEQTLKGGDQ